MTRSRIAIAHFASLASALEIRPALIVAGGEAVTVSGQPGQPSTLEVALAPSLERRLLDILLDSDATRVDVHDADL